MAVFCFFLPLLRNVVLWLKRTSTKKLANRISYQIWYKGCLKGKFGRGVQICEGGSISASGFGPRGGSKFANGFGPGSISRGVQILHDQNSRNFLFTDFLDPVFFSYSPHSSSAISDYQWSDYLDYNMITNISNWKGKILRSFAIHISQEYEKINLVHLTCSPFILRGVNFYDLDFSRCKEGSKELRFSKC